MSNLKKVTDPNLIAQLNSEKEQSIQTKPQEEGLLKSLAKGYGHYAKGAALGMAQRGGDIGASMINWPISGIEKLSGSKLPHVPHPNLLTENPASLAESVGQKLGQFAMDVYAPGGAAMKTAKMVGHAPALIKLLAAGAGGALEGAAGNEENRSQGAMIGGLIGGGGHLLGQAINAMRGMNSSNIANEIKSFISNQKEHFEKEFNTALSAAEKEGADKLLDPSKGKLGLFTKSGDTKKLYGLIEYNKNPTLINAHNAQRDLGQIERKYKGSAKDSLEYDVLKEARRLKEGLLNKIAYAMEQSAGNAEHYSNLRTEYKDILAPYLNSPSVSGLRQVNPSIRPAKFADKLLEEENFMAKAGQNHPNLLRREKYNAIKKNPFVKGAAVGTAALGITPFLPYAIAKALGLK